MQERKTTPTHELKKCPSCGNVFECKVGNVLQCQCYGIALTEAKREKAAVFGDCLCRNCLEKLSVQKTGDEG